MKRFNMIYMRWLCQYYDIFDKKKIVESGPCKERAFKGKGYLSGCGTAMREQELRVGEGGRMEFLEGTASLIRL